MNETYDSDGMSWTKIRLERLLFEKEISTWEAAILWVSDSDDEVAEILHYVMQSRKVLAIGLAKERVHEVVRRMESLFEMKFDEKIISDACEAFKKANVILQSFTADIVTLDGLKEMAAIKGERPSFLFAQRKLDQRKESTLHILVATFAKKLNLLPDDKTTAGRVKRMIECEGVTMAEKTIRTNLKEAFWTLNEKIK